MRITKYDICLVWILPQYKFAVLRYYIISFPIHFTFQYTYISQFFFWRLWCRYMRFCGVNTGADAGCGVGTGCGGVGTGDGCGGVCIGNGCCTGVGTGNGIAACPVTKLSVAFLNKIVEISCKKAAAKKEHTKEIITTDSNIYHLKKYGYFQ